MSELALPSKHYTIDQDGRLFVYGNPTQADFEEAWYHLEHLANIMPRARGNMLAHAKGAAWGGPEYITELMELSGRKRSTLYAYHSTYSRLPAENQRPGVLYSYDREVARLKPERQPAMLDRIEAGDFDNSDQVAAAVRTINRTPPPQVYAPPAPIPCPICERNGWNRERLHWAECPHCGTHGDELADKYLELFAAVRALYENGDRTELDAFARLYKFEEVE